MSFAGRNLRSLESIAFPWPGETGGPSAHFKLILSSGAILVGSLVHDRVSLLALALLGLAFALAWRARPSALARNLLPAWLLFGLVVPLPAAFLAAGSPEPIARFWVISVYPHGILAFLTLSLRVSAALAWTGALFLTDMPHRIIRSLFLPRFLRDLLAMTHGYAILLARIAWEMFLGRRARAARAGLRDDVLFLGSRAGVLLARSVVYGEKVHAAMVARGYPGYARAERQRVRIGMADVLWFLTGAGAITGAVLAGRVF